MNRKAFTLIELLIVVAIIAILAAIAVPNFLEAQVRAKVSRVRADCRTLITALETYRIDWNIYPADAVRNPVFDGGDRITAEGFVNPIVSTPVAYLTTANLPDPFIVKGAAEQVVDPISLTLFYQNVTTSSAAAFGDTVPQYEGTAPGQSTATGSYNSIKSGAGWAADWSVIYGEYKLGSLGPDRNYNGGANIYDATNGSISAGDIYRTTLRVEGGRADD